MTWRKPKSRSSSCSRTATPASPRGADKPAILSAAKDLFLRLCLVCAICVICGAPLRAQATATVADTLHAPDGSLATGKIVISASSTFTAADGTVVFQGTVATATVTSGAFSVALVPNAGSTPAGTSYVARYFLQGVAPAAETWVIPASGPVALADVRSAALAGPSQMVASSQLPTPTSSALGGVKSYAAVSHQWLDSILTTGSTHSSQPAFSDLSGQATAAQLPATIDQSALQDKGGQVFNVKAYGAVGTCAVDDYAAIHTAQFAAEAAGGILFFPPGCYLTDSTILFGLADSGLIVAGSGRYYSSVTGTIIKWGGASGATVIKLDGAYNMHLSDFVIDGNSTAGRGLDLIASSSSTSHNSAERLKFLNIGGSPGYDIGAGDGGGSGAVDNIFLDDIQGDSAVECYHQDGAQTYVSISHMNCGNNTSGWNMQNGWLSLGGTSYYGGSGTAFNIAQTSSQMSVDDFDWEGTGEFLTVQDGSNYNYVYMNNVRGHYDGLAAQSIIDIGTSTGVSGFYSLTNSQFQSIHAGANATINLRQAVAGLRFNDAGTSYTQTPATVTVAYPVGTSTHYSLNPTVLLATVAGSTTSLPANSCGDAVYVSVANATVQMVAIASPQSTPTSGLTWFSRVWTAGSVQLQYCNVTTGAIVPGAVTFNVRVIP